MIPVPLREESVPSRDNSGIESEVEGQVQQNGDSQCEMLGNNRTHVVALMSLS